MVSFYGQEFTVKDGFVQITPEQLEDIFDALAFDAAIARDEETFPGALAKALIAGENPVKIYRKYRGLSQKELAAAVNISQPAIAKIERGESGTVKTMKDIAEILRVDLDMLV